jgi:hypothetical protein
VTSMSEGSMSDIGEPSTRGDPVPRQAIAADDVLETRIVAGLDKTKLALLLVNRGPRCHRPSPTAEMALQTWIGGNMGHQDPGTSTRWCVWGLDRPPKACDEAIPNFPHLSQNSFWPTHPSIRAGPIP